MEHFRERRRPTDADIWLTAGSSTSRITLVNVSRSGMAVTGAPDVPEGTLCRIEKGPLTLFATVRWINGKKMGLALAEALNEREARVLGVRN